MQRAQRMQGRDAGFMNAGCRGAGLMSAGGQRVQGSGVQGVQRAQGCRECRGAEGAGYRGVGLMSAGRSKSVLVQGSGMQGCRGLRDARGAGHKGAGLRGAETTGVYGVQKVKGSQGCRRHMGAMLMSAGGSESAGHRGSEG